MRQPERVSCPLNLQEFRDIIDVRAPHEFTEDHIPGSLNLPVLSDAQHHKVGLLHATSPFEARRLGATLITENIHHHLATTLSEKSADFSPLLYCWRGNLRSTSMAVIFRAIGWRARILEGGYKSWRKWLLADLPNTFSPPKPALLVLGGLTGCGKTRLLHELARQGAQILDLEGLANHRGSILGTDPDKPQPTQRLFESRLWSAFKSFDPARPVFTEAESNRIGSLHLPSDLWQRLGGGTLILLDLPLAERAKLLAADYQHFIKDPDSLNATLDGLRRLRGNAQVDRWQQQINERAWPAFLTSILADHYDLVYRRPGSEDSVYPIPEHSLKPPSCSAADFETAAAELLHRYQPC